MKQSASTCCAVAIVSALKSGSSSATISPQPSTPSATIRTSGTMRASVRPKLVSKGRTSVSLMRRTSTEERRTGAAAARFRTEGDVPAVDIR